MKKILLALLCMLALAGGWYLLSPLWINTTIDEDLSFHQAETSPTPQEPDQTAESAPSTSPTLLASGPLQDADSAHKGSGTASIYTQDGAALVRLEDLLVTNGPDLRVLLTKHPAPTNAAEVNEGFVELATLKANIGNQNYPIPEGTNLSDYAGVIIYCKAFRVVFATATLTPSTDR